jgi:hypothetical protein
MPDLDFALVDEASFPDIPAPAMPGGRCQTCDYWERIDGGRKMPDANAPEAGPRESLKRSRLLAARDLAGSYAMLAYRVDAVDRAAVGYAQFGPLSAYPRAVDIRDRYPQLPESPAPWVVTCLQAGPAGSAEEREEIGLALLRAVCGELDRRGITAIEAYPEGQDDAWQPSPGPASVYEAAGFERVGGDDRFPVYRLELSGETDADAWAGLLRASAPADDDEDGWPLPLPPKRDPDQAFRLPPERPKRPNPFGDD